MDAMEFKRIRESANLTQRALADRLRVHIRSVQKWEGGERKVPGPVQVLMEQLKEESQ
jgi:DNA-binding transcriptional regulator YiaG